MDGNVSLGTKAIDVESIWPLYRELRGVFFACMDLCIFKLCRMNLLCLLFGIVMNGGRKIRCGRANVVRFLKNKRIKTPYSPPGNILYISGCCLQLLSNKTATNIFFRLFWGPLRIAFSDEFGPEKYHFQVCLGDMAALFNCRDLWCALHKWSCKLIARKTGNRLMFFGMHRREKPR